MGKVSDGAGLRSPEKAGRGLPQPAGTLEVCPLSAPVAKPEQ
jgi:hypothetical protein